MNLNYHKPLHILLYIAIMLLNYENLSFSIYGRNYSESYSLIYSLKPSHLFNKSKQDYYTDDDYTESQSE